MAIAHSAVDLRFSQIIEDRRKRQTRCCEADPRPRLPQSSLTIVPIATTVGNDALVALCRSSSSDSSSSGSKSPLMLIVTEALKSPAAKCAVPKDTSSKSMLAVAEPDLVE